MRYFDTTRGEPMFFSYFELLLLLTDTCLALVQFYHIAFGSVLRFGKPLLRWPDTIYLHIGRLFSIQIFDHSAAFDCRDILDADKEMLEVFQKCTFIEIDTNLRKFRQFSRTWFSKEMRIIGKIKRSFSFILL